MLTPTTRARSFAAEARSEGNGKLPVQHMRFPRSCVLAHLPPAPLLNNATLRRAAPIQCNVPQAPRKRLLLALRTARAHPGGVDAWWHEQLPSCAQGQPPPTPLVSMVHSPCKPSLPSGDAHARDEHCAGHERRATVARTIEHLTDSDDDNDRDGADDVDAAGEMSDDLQLPDDEDSGEELPTDDDDDESGEELFAVPNHVAPRRRDPRGEYRATPVPIALPACLPSWQWGQGNARPYRHCNTAAVLTNSPAPGGSDSTPVAKPSTPYNTFCAGRRPALRREFPELEVPEVWHAGTLGPRPQTPRERAGASGGGSLADAPVCARPPAHVWPWPWQMNRLLGRHWRELDEYERQEYKHVYAAQKQQYDKQVLVVPT